MMETVFSHMYVDPNLQQYRSAMSGKAENRDGGRYFQKTVNSWHLYIVTCVPLREHTRATNGRRAAGLVTTALSEISWNMS